jgi:hypothetical protein
MWMEVEKVVQWVAVKVISLVDKRDFSKAEMLDICKVASMVLLMAASLAVEKDCCADVERAEMLVD